MRGVSADGKPLPVEWYFVPDDRAFVPFYNRFSSLNYTEGQEGDTSLGEDPDVPRPWWNGKFERTANKDRPCGSEEVWQRGYQDSDPTTTTTKTGESACCVGKKEGLALQGGAYFGWPTSTTGSSWPVFLPPNVATPCCPDNLIPSELVAVFVEADEACWFGVQIALEWDGSAWSGTGTVGSCGYDLTLRFYCQPGAFPFPSTWKLHAGASNGCVNSVGPDPFAVNCSPLSVKFALGAGTWIGACSGEPILAGWIEVRSRERVVVGAPLDTVTTGSSTATKHPIDVTVEGEPLDTVTTGSSTATKFPITVTVDGEPLDTGTSGSSTAEFIPA